MAGRRGRRFRPGKEKMADKDERFEAGMKVRREMFGLAGADQQYESTPNFMKPLQDAVTSYCFGDGWTDPTLDRKTRSMLTIAILVSIGKPNQLRTHVRGAIANGVSVDEIRSVIMHAMIYAGVPAGVDAFLNATEVLGELGVLDQAS
jgi:4-carboxymuconolactone decarboxylase